MQHMLHLAESRNTTEHPWLSCMSAAQSHRSQVLHRLKDLLSLIKRLPSDQQATAWKEAVSTARSRKTEQDPQKQLDYLKELVAKVGYLRVITPKRAGEVRAGSGTFVFRGGQLVEGQGEVKGTRVADNLISVDEAHRRNNRDFKRLYGADKPKVGPFF